MISGEGFNDFKLWDAVSNSVLTSATDVTTSTAVTFTDTINVSANQTRTFKITADVDSDNDTSDDIKVWLLPWGTSDIRNLDNSTYVTPSSDITPNASIVGNTMVVKSPALDVGLSASPSSRTYVQGTQNAAFVGFTFNAVADDIKMTQLKVYAATTTASGSTLTTAELTNLGLYDGDTRLGDLEGLDSALTATFNNFNLAIPKNTTKNLTVKANIANDAGNSDDYYIYINALTDITNYDSAGNTVTNSGVTANSGNAVVMTIANVGDVTVTTADTSVNADIILAGKENELGRFDFTATNEDMMIKNLHIAVATSSSATGTSTTTGDDVPFIRLYDGATMLTGGSSNCVVNSVAYTGCYSVPISGASSSVVQVSNLNWVIPANQTKRLTVKGLVDAIGFSDVGADAGTEIYTHIFASGFKASGQTTDDVSITAASGQEKVIYKSKPILSKLTTSAILANGGPGEVFNFRVTADAAGDIEWKKIQFYVRMTGATMSAASAANIDLDDVTGASPNLSLATMYSSSTLPAGTQETIPGTITGGYVTLDLTNPERISAGSYKDYRLKLTFTQVDSSPNDNVTISLNRSETTVANGTWYAGITGDATSSIATSSLPSFVWSDRSALSHATSTGDWANGVYVKTFDDSSSIHN